MAPHKFSNANTMEAHSPTRCSPRSVERFCSGYIMFGTTMEQTATMLSLTHCTGWSADRVANKFLKVTGLEFPGQLAWQAHDRWTMHRRGEKPTADEVAIMRVLLQRAGVNISTFGTPLSQTCYPRSVRFVKFWSPKSEFGNPLFPGYTAEARQQSRDYISRAPSMSAHGKLTSVELKLVTLFGQDMQSIFKDVLKRWARTMLAKLRKQPDLRPIRELEHVGVIMDYLKVFQDEYESKFGKMEESSSHQLQDIEDAVCITSTAYGSKVFLGLMMADRLHVIDLKRRREREKIGFIELDVSTLEDDSRNCLICQDPMGFANPEGTTETPIKLVICCDQILGRQCLKTWLGEILYEDVYRDTCPICRFQFPESFIQKLLPREEYLARLMQQNDIEVIDLNSPSPSPSE